MTEGGVILSEAKDLSHSSQTDPSLTPFAQDDGGETLRMKVGKVAQNDDNLPVILSEAKYLYLKELQC